MPRIRVKPLPEVLQAQTEIDPTQPVRILSFDPGTSCIGWAMSIYDPTTDVLEVQKYGDLRATKLAAKQKELNETYGTRLLALQEIEQLVSKLARSFNPDFVASEDTFFYAKSPSAYGALLLCVYTIERTLFREYELSKTIKFTARKLYKYAPRNIKLIASGNSMSFKGNMLTALVENRQITFKLKDDETVDNITSSLNEHQVDAISCGFAFVKSTLPSILYGT